MHPNRILAYILLGASLACCPARAQDYPSRPVHIVVAFPAGGPTDIVARLLADKLSTSLGVNFLVENKSGANGTLGADFVAKSEPDGYNLFLTTVGAVTVSPHLWDIPYDPLRDYAPVIHVVRNTTIVVVNPALKITTAKELAALAKAKPGQMPWASTGIGGTPHLALELFQDAAGVKFLHVPYRGAAPAVTDLLGGQVSVFAGDVPVLLPHIQSGKLVPVGAAADLRSAALPDVATLAEQGYAGTDATNWYGLLAPAKTPPAVVAKLNTAINALLRQPDVRAKLLQLGAEPVGGSPEEFGRYLKSEYDRWGKVIRDKGLKQ